MRIKEDKGKKKSSDFDTCALVRICKISQIGRRQSHRKSSERHKFHFFVSLCSTRTPFSGFECTLAYLLSEAYFR